MLKAKPWWLGETPPPYWSYHNETGELLASGKQDPSPLEPGVWLLPGSSTTVQPMPTREGHIACWRGGAWQEIEDHRGEIVWLDGEFRTVTSLGSLESLGLQPLQVHDAEYYLPEGATDPNGAMIHMWVNDDEIGFDDDPNLVARRVLAAWEAKGETIRPLAFDDTDYEPEEPPPPLLTPEEQEARRLEQLAADMDKLAQQGVEGIPVPHEE